MGINDLIKILSGGIEIAKSSAEVAKSRARSYADDYFIKGNYVAREEFEILKLRLDKLEKDLKAKK